MQQPLPQLPLDGNTPIISSPAPAAAHQPQSETGHTTAAQAMATKDKHQLSIPPATMLCKLLPCSGATEDTATAASTAPLLLLLMSPINHQCPSSACWAASAARHPHQLLLATPPSAQLIDASPELQLQLHPKRPLELPSTPSHHPIPSGTALELHLQPSVPTSCCSRPVPLEQSLHCICSTVSRSAAASIFWL